MKNLRVYLLLCFLVFIFQEISKYFLNINGLVFQNLSQQFTLEQASKIFGQIRRWQFLGYLVSPLLLFIKTILIASVLSMGCFLFNKEIKFKKLWNLVLKAEFVFIIPIIVTTLWFCFFQKDFTLDSLQNFYPLSFLNLIDPKNVDLWFQYPLQLINVFELAYLLILTYFLDKELETPVGNHTGIKLVASSYLPALLIWIVAVMFVILNNT